MIIVFDKPIDYHPECKKYFSEIEPHTCPFRESVYGDYTSLCQCCPCEKLNCYSSMELALAGFPVDS